MSKITKCLNEWNTTIEALGQGKQSILIRKYGTTLNEFLLYPTISYANKDNILDSFKGKYQGFVKDNLLPAGEDKKYEVKYYATLEEVLQKSSAEIDAFKKFHILTKTYVKNYLGDKEARIWILRVYKLKKPKYLSRSAGILYSDVNEPVKLKGKPVLSNKEFKKLKKEILNTKNWLHKNIN